MRDRQPHSEPASKQAARDDEARLRAILDTAVDGIITIDEYGTIEAFNRSAECIFGYSAEDVIGKNVSILMPSPERESHDRYLRAYMAGGPAKIIGIGREVIGLRKGDIPFPMDLAVSEFWHSGRRLFTGIVRDISERKQTEERLLRTERLAAIGEAMAGLVHESRNALQRSQAGLEMLARRVDDRPDAQEMIQRVQHAHDDLNQLYEDVREYAAPIRLELEWCDLSVILRNAWSDLQVARRDRATDFRELWTCDGQPTTRCDLDLTCRVDAFIIRQVFRNVLENCLTACCDVSEIKIEIEYHVAAGGSWPGVVVFIRDNGTGLNPEVIQKMFDAFYTTRTRGTGLGLAIARRFLEAHKGEIDAMMRREGAEIVIKLPRQQL
ncbi:MAG: PAS domain S-box protein [Planctomycetaceae bacterium]